MIKLLVFNILLLFISFTTTNAITHVAMYGNPASGKSTLLNILTDKAGNFPSGLNSITGLTKRQTSRKYRGVVYIDTPGLADVHDREKAALEIEESFKKDQDYKPIFVIAPTSGRMSPADLATMNIILQSIPDNIQYGIIYNKLSERTYREFTQDPNLLETLHQTLLLRKPHSYLLLENMKELFEIDNAMTRDEQFISDLKNFVAELPQTHIVKEDVAPLPANEYENKMKEMEEYYKLALEEYKQQITKLEEKYNKSCIKYETQSDDRSTPFEKQSSSSGKMKLLKLRTEQHTTIEKGDRIDRYLRTNCVKGDGVVEYGEWIYAGTREVVTNRENRKSYHSLLTFDNLLKVGSLILGK